MRAENFIFWLQGQIELNEAGGKSLALDEAQMQCVKKHLALVFIHEIDPATGDNQDKLNEVHGHKINQYVPASLEHKPNPNARC